MTPDLDDIHRQNKEKILNENRDVFLKKDNVESTMDEEINMNELVMVLNGIRNTATGEDQLTCNVSEFTRKNIRGIVFI